MAALQNAGGLQCFPLTPKVPGGVVQVLEAQQGHPDIS